METPKPTPSLTNPPVATDAHIITAKEILERAKVSRPTMSADIRNGHLEPGAARKGKRKKFWTIGQVNAYLKRIDRRGFLIERS